MPVYKFLVLLICVLGAGAFTVWLASLVPMASDGILNWTIIPVVMIVSYAVRRFLKEREDG